MTTTAKPVHAHILRKLITIDGDDMHGHPQTHEAGALVALTADEAAHLVDAGIAERTAVEGDATTGQANTELEFVAAEPTGNVWLGCAAEFALTDMRWQ